MRTSSHIVVTFVCLGLLVAPAADAAAQQGRSFERFTRPVTSQRNGFDRATGTMTLRSLHPGITLDDLRANTGWGLHVPDGIELTAPPTCGELRLLREELDPDGYYLKRRE